MLHVLLGLRPLYLLMQTLAHRKIGDMEEIWVGYSARTQLESMWGINGTFFVELQIKEIQNCLSLFLILIDAKYS